MDFLRLSLISKVLSIGIPEKDEFEQAKYWIIKALWLHFRINSDSTHPIFFKFYLYITSHNSHDQWCLHLGSKKIPPPSHLATLFFFIQKGITKASQRDVIVEEILNSFLSIWSESKSLASWITLSTNDVTIKWLVSSSQMTTDSTSVNNDLQVRTFETLRTHPMWIFIKTFLHWISFGFSIFRLIWGKYQETTWNCSSARGTSSIAMLLLSRFCVSLCDPIDGSPPGSPVPGILQARTLEWVANSSSNAWKWKVKVKALSCVRLLATPWTVAYQAPLSMGFSRQEYWSGVPLPSPEYCYEKGLIPLLCLSISPSLSHTHTHTHTHDTVLYNSYTWETFITFAWLLHQPDTCAMPVGRQRRGNPRGRSSYTSFLQEVNSACDTPTTSPSSILGSSEV